MMTLYIKGTKKAANEALAAGQHVTGTNFSPFGDYGDHKLSSLKAEAVIKFYTKIVSGSPVAAAYGTYSPKTGRIK